MENTQKLSELMNEFPNREVIFMYPEDGSDHYYTLGKPSKVEIDKYVLIDEKVYFKSDEDSLYEDIADWYEMGFFSNEDFPLNEEQEKEVDVKTKETISKVDWKEVIVVYIQPK